MSRAARRLALPPALEAAWAAVSEADAQLAAALDAGDTAQFAVLASERHRRIVDFFERYPLAGESLGLRAELLHELVAANARMLDAGRAQLQQAAQLTAASRHSRRAIHAYHDRSASSET